MTLPLPLDVWEAVPTVAQALLLEQFTRLRRELAVLEQRVRELRARLGQYSSNASRPPSSDPPQAPLRRQPGPSGRRPDGQPGHEAHQRVPHPDGQGASVHGEPFGRASPEPFGKLPGRMGTATTPKMKRP